MLSSRLCLLLACLLFSAVSVQATIRMVPSQYAKIQHAVDLANDGDTIQLAPMTYNGVDNLDIMIMNKGLTIMGNGDPTQVVIDASGEPYHRGFLVINATSDTRFANLSIYGATASDQDTNYWTRGGGLLVENSEVSVTNCHFFKDQAVDAGGAIYAGNSRLTVENCDFDTCWAIMPGGGSIYCWDCDVCTISNSRFTHNFAGTAGAAIFTTGTNLSVRDCNFSDGATFRGLIQLEGYGGAIYTQHGTANISHCNFLRNSAYREGGAIEGWYCSLRIDSCLFADNVVKCVYEGGGKALIGEGGALYESGETCIINSCSFVSSSTECSTSVVVIWADTAEVNHSLIANSIGSFAYTGNATFTCSNIFGNEFGDWTGNIASQLGQNGNVSADPQFCLAFPGDYRVAIGSPCDPAVSGCGLLIGSEPAGCDVVCGDADFSGRVSISDAVFLIRYIFANGDPPLVQSSGDVSCNGVVNISDVVYLVNYIFASGPVPCAACP